MKKQNVILHIVNNSYDSVYVVYENQDYSKDIAFFETFKKLQNCHFWKTIIVVDEIRYQDHEEIAFHDDKNVFVV